MPVILPPVSRLALLLDLDGTLLDLAPTPDSVVVPPGLADSLLRLRARLDDALAVVTGRPIVQIDALLPGIPHAVAGEHGGAIRHAPDAGTVRIDLPDPPDAWRKEAEAVVAAHPGALLEQKRRGFVFHYRAVPAYGPALHAAAYALVAANARFQVMQAAMAWEIRPAGADKGSAVQAVMRHPPFQGRLPVFIGDDVTDEDGIRAAVALGGAGLRVDDAFGAPAAVRSWLASAAAMPGDLLPPPPLMGGGGPPA